MTDMDPTQPIIDFLRRVGICVNEETIEGETFLPGIALRHGALVVDRQRLRWPGDLLHEAGHIAVLPERLRHLAHDALDGDIDAEHAGEQEALAWAYAAAMALGLPLPVLIHEGGYRGKSAALLQMYRFGIYPGLRGLCAAGLTQARGFTSGEVSAPYPAMVRWLRE